MPGYLEQIPKQLAARRKAFRAARDNPALLPSCWAIVRSIANNIYDYMRNAVIGGCTFPDRPVLLSAEDAAFINLGVTHRLLMQDGACMEAEREKLPPPGDDAEPSPETAAELRRRLASLTRLYAEDQRSTHVYNLVPWLEDMYRDKLDVDFAEDLQRQIDALNAYMDSVPKSIAATGLNPKLVKGVMDAFRLFKTITGSSHQLDREKMSFVDRRSYVDTIQKIELIMTKADESLGAAMTGRSVVREQFGLWKDANYEMMALTRQLRVLWAGTSLDDRIQELSDLFWAVQKAMNRCGEEARVPSPQLPVYRADDERTEFIAREAIVRAFADIRLFDVIAGDQPALQVREIRKFGPLAAVVTPGAGEPRYCWEVRKLGAADEEARGKRRPAPDTASGEREKDVDRRVRYPLNCLVVPAGSEAPTFDRDLADAWLEYNQRAFPAQFKDFLEAAKSACPASFAPAAEGEEAKDLSAAGQRRILAGLCARFADWARDGGEAETGDASVDADFPGFRDFVLSRLDSRKFFPPLRHRPLALLFSEAGSKRRLEMWKRLLGPRFALDRQLVAVCVLMKDWDALRSGLKFLPVESTRGNSALANAFAKVNDASDPFAENKAEVFFRKFLTEQPDLKSALVVVESQVAIEVETLRTQSESLGRVFQYDRASKDMLRRQASQIQEKRMAADAHIDQYLAGLLYAYEGNYEAAEATLVQCLSPAGDGEDAGAEGGDAGEEPEEAGPEWFEKRMAPLDDKFARRLVPGEDGPGTECREYLFYNLGLVYLKGGRNFEAALCFGEMARRSSGEPHLLRLWAGECAEAAREGMRAETN